jgi:hypothetical protein
MPDEYGMNTTEEIRRNRRIEAILTPDAQIVEMADPCTCGMHKLGPHFPAHGHAHNCPVQNEWSRQHHAACEAVNGATQ